MNHSLKKFLLVFGVSGLLFWLVKPRPKTSKSDTAKDVDPLTQKKNAAVALKAYGTALKAGETPEALEELNRSIQTEYGLRVYRKQSDGKYYVADTKGNDILKA